MENESRHYEMSFIFKTGDKVHNNYTEHRPFSLEPQNTPDNSIMRCHEWNIVGRKNVTASNNCVVVLSELFFRSRNRQYQGKEVASRSGQDINSRENSNI